MVGVVAAVAARSRHCAAAAVSAYSRGGRQECDRDWTLFKSLVFEEQKIMNGRKSRVRDLEGECRLVVKKRGVVAVEEALYN